MKPLGDFRSLNIAYSKDDEIRDKGAGGGVVSSLLINALEEKFIDGAVVVGMDSEHPWKIKVKVAKTKNEILEAAGSKYTLIPIKDILDKINKETCKLAMVGLPCHIKVIRNLQKQGKYQNVKFLIGLFCGYNIPPKATDFLIKKMGVKKENIKYLKYRGGPYPGGFFIETKDGKTKLLPKYYYDFVNLMFVPKGCLVCKDFTNETADISVGDTYGYTNCSLTIIRTNFGEKLTKNDLINLKPISEKEVIQMHWHNIKHKKIGDSLIIQTARIILKAVGRFIPLPILGVLARIRRKTTRKWQD